jgi:hypothetical protein
MAEAKERVFTASRGYELADTGPDGEYRKWAEFTPDPERQQPNGPAVFSFSTTDAKVADRLLKADADHGITEVTASK